MLSNKTASTGLNNLQTLGSADTLCSLPSELAFQVLISRYITVGTMAVYLWDDLDSVVDHYKLLVERRIRLPTIIYFISRLCCLGYVLCAAISQTNPRPTCVLGLVKTVDYLFSFSIISTSLLFFLRTRAVFDNDPCVVAFFAGSWLAVVAACLTFVINAGNVRSVNFCINNHLRPFEIAATIVPLVNDTLVFAAITWRLYRNSYAHTLRDGIRTLVFGDYLPMFSKAFLQDGQAYYLTTITINLVTMIMLFNNTIPVVLGMIFAIPNVVLMNIMACRVFRNTIFRYRETEIPTGFVSRELNGMGAAPLSLQGDVQAASVTNTQMYVQLSS